MRTPFYISSILLLASTLPVWAASYSHVIGDGNWRTEATPFQCRLINAVPFYGDAIFRRGAGEFATTFFLETPIGRFTAGPAQVVAEAPVWKPEIGIVYLGEIAVEQGKRPVQLEERETEALLAQLLEGREVVVAREAQYIAEQKARLAISSVGFRPAYRQYLSCLASLLPANFQQIKRTAVYFDAGQFEEIPDSEALKLDQILLYAQADPHLKELYIDGHADRSGTREANLKLSEERAKLVAEYLVKRGLPEDRIVVRWHGERYPVQNSGESAQNRRVTLRLERVEPIKVPTLAAAAAE